MIPVPQWVNITGYFKAIQPLAVSTSQTTKKIPVDSLAAMNELLDD